MELLTRITTQPLPDEVSDEEAALASVHALFPLTREIIKSNGRQCFEFTKRAIVVLNQIVRPFSAKWLNGRLQVLWSVLTPALSFGPSGEICCGSSHCLLLTSAGMADVEEFARLGSR